MPLLAASIITIPALLLTVVVGRTSRPPAARRRDEPGHLLGDVAWLFLVALFFPLWDYGLIDALGLPLVRLWSPRPGVTVGVVALLLMPLVAQIVRRRRTNGLGWRPARHEAAALLVMAVLAVLGTVSLLLGANVAHATLFDVLLTLVTVVLLDENLFRGALQSRLELVLAGEWPWFISGLLYGVWYAPALLWGAGGDTLTVVAGLLATVSLGWLLGITRDRTGSLLPGIVAHFLFLTTGPLLAWLVRP